MQQRQIQRLEQRLIKAEMALAKLVQKPGNDAKVLQTNVDAILQHHRVSEYLAVTLEQKLRYNKVYNGSGRPGANRPYRRVRQTLLLLDYRRLEPEIALAHTLALVATVRYQCSHNAAYH